VTVVPCARHEEEAARRTITRRKDIRSYCRDSRCRHCSLLFAPHVWQVGNSAFAFSASALA
jgi:hypothetical protein